MNINDVQPISTKQLRETMPSIKERLLAGESFYWIDRSKPIGMIKPLEPKRKAPMNANEYRQNIRKIAGGINSKKPLSPKELNRLLDKRYEEMLSGQ